MSMHTGQIILRYYDNEDDAIEYINYILLNDASTLLP